MYTVDCIPCYSWLNNFFALEILSFILGWCVKFVPQSTCCTWQERISFHVKPHWTSYSSSGAFCYAEKLWPHGNLLHLERIPPPGISSLCILLPWRLLLPRGGAWPPVWTVTPLFPYEYPLFYLPKTVISMFMLIMHHYLRKDPCLTYLLNQKRLGAYIAQPGLYAHTWPSL